eukprot:4302258-Prymnesium_polylepis.4
MLYAPSSQPSAWLQNRDMLSSRRLAAHVPLYVARPLYQNAPVQRRDKTHPVPVSYTHLTLPTICSV